MRVTCDGDSDLPQIREANRATALFFSDRQSREKHCGKDRYDGDDDEQFNQREGVIV
jgi:hypothetical protein